MAVPAPAPPVRASCRLLAAVALALLLARASAVQCPAPTYTYGGSSCSPCAPGAAFTSPADGCSPSATLMAGPADTAFYLSGTSAEGAAAFAAAPGAAQPAFAPGPFGTVASALKLANNSYLTAAKAPAALPTGSSAWSASAWVKCPASRSAAPAFPPFGGTFYFAPINYPWYRHMRTCNFLANTEYDYGVGDFSWLIVEALNGNKAPGSVSVLSVSNLWNYALTIVDSVGRVGIAENPDANDASWILTPGLSDPSNWTLVSQTKSSRLAKFVLTVNELQFTNNCSWGPDVVVAAPSLTIARAQTWNLGQAYWGVELSSQMTPPPAPPAAVLEWGASGDALGGLSPQALAIVVSGVGASVGVVSTLAASGSSKPVNFSLPMGITKTSSGSYLIADWGANTIRSVSPSGIAITLAGNGTPAFADGAGVKACFNQPSDVAVLPSGAIAVVDQGNHRVRLISSLGVVSSLAGNGSAALADGQGTSASFSSPAGCAVIKATGTIVVADSGNNVIRLVSLFGLATTLAGNGIAGSFDGTGAEAQFSAPTGIAVIERGGTVTIVVSDYGSHVIRLVSYPRGEVTTLAGTLTIGFSTTTDSGILFEYDTGPSMGFRDEMGTNAKFSGPAGLSFDAASSSIVVADSNNCRIRLVSYPGGVVTTIAGNGRAAFADGTGTAASLNVPFGVSVHDGVAAVADFSNGLVRLVALPLVLPACDDTWRHVALTYAPPLTLSAYLDGSLVFNSAASAITLPPASSSSLRVGWSGDLAAGGAHSSPFVGSLAELRIYARALGAAEIVALSQPPLPAAAHSLIVPSAPTSKALTYSWTCAAGFSGPTTMLSKNLSDNSWSTVPAGASSHCSTCAASCSANSYSYGAGCCASCPAGASLSSQAGGCLPSSSQTPGPTDTAFYLSGSQAEGVGAFSVAASALVRYSTGPFGAAGGALTLASGTFLTVEGPSAPPTLPSGRVAFSASAWVKCPAPAQAAAVIEWGAPGDALGDAAPQAAALLISGTTALTGGCPAGWAESASLTCYKVFNRADTWANSHAFCKLQGLNGGLASASSPADWAALKFVNNGASSWIGGHDQGRPEFNFSFVRSGEDATGALLPHWNDGEPNDWFGIEHCVQMYSNDALNDLDCDWPLYALCEIDAVPTLFACDLSWHHVALTYSPSEALPLSGFVDGARTFQIAASITLPARSSSSLRVGWGGDMATNGGSLFEGSLAELRVYSRALSAAEVVALSQPPLAAFANTIVTPAVPVVGQPYYVFGCAPGATGQPGVMARNLTGDGSWAWAGGMVAACVIPASSPLNVAIIASLVVVLVAAVVVAELIRRRNKRRARAKARVLTQRLSAATYGIIVSPLNKAAGAAAGEQLPPRNALKIRKQTPD